MENFFPIETPYSSKDYEIMKNVVNKGIDSHLEGFVKSEFKKSPVWSNKFLWNIHASELPILYRRLQDLYGETGDDDYIDFLNDIESLSKTAEYEEKNIEEELDPYDPMDLNQTISGEPTPTSDLYDDGVDTAPAYAQGPVTRVNQGIEDYIDDDTKAQMLAKENSSDSLTNAHGENLKPETLDEITDTERYEQVVYLQGEEANEAMDILNNEGKDAAMEYLKQWHQPGIHMGSNEPGHGTEDKTYEKDGYIMAWNPYLPYIGLVYDTENDLNEEKKNNILTDTELKDFEEKITRNGIINVDDIFYSALSYLENHHKELDNKSLHELSHTLSDYVIKKLDLKNIDEDSQMMRHRAGQREKIGKMPLGQHAPHSQAALEETEGITLPENKPSMNGKYKTKDAIKNAIYNILKTEQVEGRYSDENWEGVKKLKDALSKHGIDYNLRGSSYKGQGEIENSSLPTRKVYIFDIEVRDKEGKVVSIPLQVTCAFVGKTGTMADSEYELTYYLMA